MHHSIDFSKYQLSAQFFSSSTIYMLHYTPQLVSSSTLLIIRRTNCITTASGIVTLCKQPYSMRVESGLQSALHPRTARLSVEWRYQRLWWYNWSSWWWAACCSKHVEECSVTYIYCWRLKELCTKLIFWKVCISVRRLSTFAKGIRNDTCL